jgi:hypothetical protein
MSFPPTDEQQAAIDGFATGENLVIEAGAGTGKTSTLRYIADVAPQKQGLYLAFNKAIQTEAARKFDGTAVTAKTAHSLAYAKFGRPNQEKLNAGNRMRAADRAKVLGINNAIHASVRGSNESRRIPNHVSVRLVEETVKNFCRSGAQEITADMVTIPEQLMLTDGEAESLRNQLLPYALKYWVDIIHPDGKLPYNHDFYLKQWALSNPKLEVDYILFDEAQDSDPLIFSVVQAQDHAQIVAVGDSNQAIYCQPAGTMVEVPTEGVRGDAGTICVGPFCYRKRDHASSGLCDLHNRQESRSEPLTRIRGSAESSGTHQVPIESLVAGDLVVTYNNSHTYKRGKAISSVTTFEHDGELVQATIGGVYTSSYTPQHHCIVRLNREMIGKHVVYVMQRGDQFRVGRTPLFYASQGNTFGLGARARAEKADAAWILSIHDSSAEAALAEALVWSKFGLPGMRFKASENDVLDLKRFWHEIGNNTEQAHRALIAYGRLIDLPLWVSKGQPMGLRVEITTAAANLFDGLLMLTSGNEITRRGREHRAPAHMWTPITVARKPYTGAIYSLEVSDHHTYFGDGILTHNSWRGAIDAMENFDGDRFQLTQSFRFGEAIAEEANVWLDLLDASLRIRGSDKPSSVHESKVAVPNAVLCRTNAGAIGEVMDMQHRGITTAISGKGKSTEMKNLALAAKSLIEEGWTRHPHFDTFKSWEEVQEYAGEDDGADIAPLVKLVDQYSPERLISAIENCVPEDRADTVVATAHVAKGLEWRHVRIADDFKVPSKDDEGEIEIVPQSDLMLAYVSVTRAMRHLDPAGLSWVRDYKRSLAQPELGTEWRRRHLDARQTSRDEMRGAA